MERASQPRKTNTEDLSGRRFGSWLVLAEAPKRKGRRYVMAACDCGVTREVYAHTIVSGASTTCGCSRKKNRPPRTDRTTHGHRSHGIYSGTYASWLGLVSRGRGVSARKDYFDRGIRVCDRWLKFENFLADMGERPPGMSIDRYPNNDGNYEPGNCRWATRVQQNRNTRANVNLTHGGETMCMIDWASRLGISHATIHNRLRAGQAFSDIVRHFRPEAH